jgi:uncharacterized membrane protein YheB (UPF0754 family)
MGGKNNGIWVSFKKQLVFICRFFAAHKTNTLMNWWVYATPLLPALLGWCLVSLALRLLFHPAVPKKIAGWQFRGLVPAKQSRWAADIGQWSAQMISVTQLADKITDPGNVKKIMPYAGEHIDHFLRVKLVKSMPMIGMFVGDKTINTLKELFMAELELLFPQIMQQYIGRLQEDIDIAAMVTGKIAAIPPATIESYFVTSFKKEIRLCKLSGALFGVVLGSLQLMLILLFH